MHCNYKEYEPLLEVIKKNLLTWKDVSLDDVKFTKMQFGHSSDTYKVEAPYEMKIIFRKFKSHNHGYVDYNSKDKLNLMFKQLSEEGLAPKLFYYDNFCRIEEYIDSRVILSVEINDTQIRKKLAIRLGYFNSFPKYDNKGTGFFIDFLNEEIISNFSKSATSVSEDFTSVEREEFGKLVYLGNKAEVDFIKKLCNERQQVFSHNDIWCGNILNMSDGKDVMFIDYEKVGVNFLGYDIGKLILETIYTRKEDSPEFDINYFLFPLEEDIKDFLRYYLVAFNHRRLKITQHEEILNSLEYYENILYKNEKEKEETLTKLLKDTYVGMLVSCFYMTFMGVLISKTITTMDFVKFAIESHKHYLNFKEIITK